MSTRARFAALLTAIALGMLVVLPSTVADAHGCKYNPKKCETPTPTVTATATPEVTPTATVEPTPSATPTAEPTETPEATPPAEEPQDSCVDVNPACDDVTPSPTPPSATATPSATPVAATPTPVVPVPTAVPSAPKPPVQLPPSGELPGPPDTGSGGMRALVDVLDAQALYKPVPNSCYLSGTYPNWRLVCKVGGWLN